MAALESELFEDVGEVFFDGEFGRAKDGADIRVALALGNPQEHFSFARGQAEPSSAATAA